MKIADGSLYEHYMIRVKMGGWDEEIFYSLHIGLDYVTRTLKNEDMMLLYLLKSWQSSDQTRIEPLFELVKYYREKKDYKMAKMFYLIAKDIPLPPNRMFFSFTKTCMTSNWIKNTHFMAFYNGDVKRCLPSVLKNYSFHMVQYLYMDHFNNYKFYVPYLEAYKQISLQCTHPIVIDDDEHIFHGSSPSIIPYLDGYMVNVRLVNYKIREDGSYDIQHGVVATLNKCIIYDKGFKMVAETILDKDTAGPTPSGWPTPLKGIEDIKLSMCDKQIWYTGTMCH